MHQRTHNERLTEKRGDTIVTRGMSVFSRKLGVSGKCDVLEFHRDPAGVPLAGWEGCWLPFPVEYKRGEPKANNCDAAQLCGQAMCLEAMLCCDIPRGALFYGEIKRRVPVEFDQALRHEVTEALTQMHELLRRGATPKVKPGRFCNACSLKDTCLPGLMKKASVADYLKEGL